MFNLFRKSQPHQPTPALCQALINEGLPPAMDPSTLRVIERRGSYSGRGVRYFRVFDGIRVTERALQVRRYADLDTTPELVLGSGHFEADGAVVLSKRNRPVVTTHSVRTEADRSARVDDERLASPH